MKPTGSEAERPETPLPQPLISGTSALKLVQDETAHISLFPTGHTPLDYQLYHFHCWAEKKLHSPAGQFMAHYNFGPVNQPRDQRAEENKKTLALFKDSFTSFMWTGIECSNPESPTGERWDQLAFTDIYNPESRQKQIQLIQNAGIENVRLGLPNHLMVEQNEWEVVTALLNDFKVAGLKVSLDLQHFGLPASFRNNQNPEESNYLNPAWPEHYVDFALQVVKTYLPQLDALTLINEPMITNRFSACFWNEAMPGRMDHEKYNYFFIKRALLIGKAAVKARYEIEQYLQTQKNPRIPFIHNESCEKHAENPDFNDYGRFLCSDLILGQEWLLEGDFTQSDMFAWMKRHLVTEPASAKEDLANLIKQVQEIKNLHSKFESDFGKTMKADTVFGVDYYAACETVMQTNGFPKPTSVEHYTDEVMQGHRLGLAGISIEYWNRYQIPMLHTETNFVDHGEQSHVGTSDDWGLKQLIEFAQLPKFNIPILGFTWYSLMDQFNWHNGMQGSPEHLVLHPVGLYSWPEYQARPFMTHIMPGLQQALNQGSVSFPAHH